MNNLLPAPKRIVAAYRADEHFPLTHHLEDRLPRARLEPARSPRNRWHFADETLAELRIIQTSALFAAPSATSSGGWEQGGVRKASQLCRAAVVSFAEGGGLTPASLSVVGMGASAWTRWRPLLEGATLGEAASAKEVMSVVVVSVESDAGDETAERLIRYAFSALLGRKAEPEISEGLASIELDAEAPDRAREAMAVALADAAYVVGVGDWRRHVRIAAP